MDTLFFSWQFILLALLSYVFTDFLKRYLDLVFAGRHFYQTVFLPTLPVMVGVVTGLCLPLALLAPGISGNVAKGMVGAVAGLLSTTAYRTIRAYLRGKAGLAGEETDAP